VLALFPISSFILLVLVFKTQKLFGWRISFLIAAVTWGVFLTLATEILSLFFLIDLWPLVIVWSLFSLGLIILLARRRFSLHEAWGDLQGKIRSLIANRFDTFLLVCLIIILGVVWVIALVAAPNTWDSMTYHLGRVLHWIQNKSISFYPTSIIWQLFLNPWGEFAILHFQILSRGDHFSNLVQWFSMVGSVSGVTLIAKELKASKRGQLLAAIVCVTIPSAILQGSSTQNDLAASFWLVCFVYFILLLMRDLKIVFVLSAGSALGLAVLTKATAYIVAFPFVVWFLISSMKTFKKQKIIWIALIGLIALGINFGHYSRNYDLFGSPLGPREDPKKSLYVNEIITVPSILSNMMRNVALQIGTPSSIVNRNLERSVVFLHKIIHISPNDTRISFPNTEFNIRWMMDANPIHLLILLLTSILYLIQKPREKVIGCYILTLIIGFVLYSGYLKWQPWGGRLQLPFIVLSAPFIGAVLAMVKKEIAVNIGILLVIISSFHWVFENTSRPVLGKYTIFKVSRVDQYFTEYPFKQPYLDAMKVLQENGCENIGLIIGGNTYEYPLWAILKYQYGMNVRLEHLVVTNESKNTKIAASPAPKKLCALFTENMNPPDTIQINNSIFKLDSSSQPFNIYTGE
jgi:hypothetical protein